jgi:hypothetical protein
MAVTVPLKARVGLATGPSYLPGVGDVPSRAALTSLMKDVQQELATMADYPEQAQRAGYALKPPYS